MRLLTALNRFRQGRRPRQPALLLLATSLLAAGCVVEAPEPRYVERERIYVPPPAPPRGVPPPLDAAPFPPTDEGYGVPPPGMPAEPPPAAVVSVYVEPPLEQPPPIAVPWAPPPMLVELPPPQPFAEAIWIGGYWVWDGDWIWAAGRWAPPPRPGYYWIHPYYEHRDTVVVFITGHWCSPGRSFEPPPRDAHVPMVSIGPGVTPGQRPQGPQGVFVPPPPGSRRGLIVPAPVNTAPAVVVGAPPMIQVGMRVQGNNNTVNNITNVTIVAPAGTTRSGQAFQRSVPAAAHLAAAQPAVVPMAAPPVRNAQPVPAFQPGRGPATLPPAQWVRPLPPPPPAPAPPPRVAPSGPLLAPPVATSVPGAPVAHPQGLSPGSPPPGPSAGPATPAQATHPPETRSVHPPEGPVVRPPEGSARAPERPAARPPEGPVVRPPEGPAPHPSAAPVAEPHARPESAPVHHEPAKSDNAAHEREREHERDKEHDR